MQARRETWRRQRYKFFRKISKQNNINIGRPRFLGWVGGVRCLGQSPKNPFFWKLPLLHWVVALLTFVWLCQIFSDCIQLCLFVTTLSNFVQFSPFVSRTGQDRTGQDRTGQIDKQMQQLNKSYVGAHPQPLTYYCYFNLPLLWVSWEVQTSISAIFADVHHVHLIWNLFS